MGELHTSDALAEVWKLISRANKYIDETTPWTMAKDPEQANNLSAVMAHLAASLRVVAILLQPVLTNTPKAIFEQLGLSESNLQIADLSFDALPTGGRVVEKGQPIFPRVDVDAEVAYIRDEMTGGAPKAEADDRPEKLETKPEIEFDDLKRSIFVLVRLRRYLQLKSQTNCCASS
ncbi:Methionine--tRNA ligase [Weissella viridescens]|uniref:Methionine--tRNA ligase n=1 Tax=Weissella viridescens TaxID=1629 RepID=A0A380P9T1_WEIVI|nr:Methionine--tRNA ligase [Weissella viridescens]